MTQIWTANADAGACHAYAHCSALEPGARCERLGDSAAVVQLEEVPCLAGRPDVRQWDIGQLASDGSCVILSAKCGADLAPCTPSARQVSCPAQAIAAPTDESAASATLEIAATARGNLDRGRAALNAKNPKLAREYFEYVRQRFPFSTLAHDAELGLVDADALAFRATPAGTSAPIESHCAFIAHHPWHPRVVSGDVACQIEKLQNRPCAPGDRAAERSCAPAASRSSHEAELALIEQDLVGVPITEEASTAPLCAFIEHHPFAPEVTTGEVACRINKLQGEACVPQQIVPIHYCRLSYCEDPNGEGHGRPECKR